MAPRGGDAGGPACDVPETRAAAAAGRRGCHCGAGRPAACAGARAGRGPGRRRLRACLAASPSTASGGAARLPLPRPDGRDGAPQAACLLGPALLQPLPLEPTLQARYVEADDPRNKCIRSHLASCARLVFEIECAVPERYRM